MKQFLIHATAVVMLASSYSASATGFYDRQAEGWFWYEDPELIEEEDTEPEPPAPPPVEDATPEKETEQQETTAAAVEPKGPPPLSAEWFRANLQIYVDRAVDNPTPENIEAYYLLQRVMMDKAQTFAQVSQEVVIGNPYIDETMRRPMSQAGFNQLQASARLERQKLVEKVANDAGLVFFFDANCQLCGSFAELLDFVRQAYGIRVLAVSLDGTAAPEHIFDSYTIDQGQAADLGVHGGPALFLAIPPDTWAPLARGLVTEEELLKRIAIAAKSEGLVTDQEYMRTTTNLDAPNLAGVLDDIDELPEDPQELIDLLKSMGQ